MSVEPTVPTSAAGRFAPTHWTVVLQARGDSAQAQAALERLCHIYWPPIYAFVRRQGHTPHDAQDLTQDFFTRLVENDALTTIDPTKGKFRSFLLASLKHFLANEWHKARAQKRGGGKTIISIDEKAAEPAVSAYLADHESADRVFERRWAMALLDQTLARLREEYVADGKAALFESLKHTLTGERSSLPYAILAQQLNTSEGNIKVAVHRLRQRYREVLRAEIADTVTNPDEVEEELRCLFAAIS